MAYLPIVFTLIVAAASLLNHFWRRTQSSSDNHTPNPDSLTATLTSRMNRTAGNDRSSSENGSGATEAISIVAPSRQDATCGLSPAAALATTGLPVALIGLSLLVAANARLYHQNLSLFAGLALLAGLSLWALYLWSNRGWEIVTTTRPAIDRLRVTPQLALLTVAAVAGLFAWRLASDNHFRVNGVIAWCVTIAAWLGAWWPARQEPAWFKLSQNRRLRPEQGWALAVGLMAITGVGVFYRFFRIRLTPGDPTSDHAEKAGDIYRLLHGQHYVFFEMNTGREPAQFYLTAAMIELFHLPTDWVTLKLGTAAIGVLTIPFIYLFVAEIAGRYAGLTAALLFSVAKWPVAISRAGLRFPYAVLWGAVTLWFLMRWMRTGDRRDALLCGAAMGCGLYGYTPFRVVAIVVGMGFAIELLDPRWKGHRRQIIEQGLLALGTALVIFIPLGRYAWDEPRLFFSRTTESMKAEAGTPVSEQVATFLHNIWNFLLAFNWQGDSTMVNMVSYQPFLDVITGGLLLAGALTAVYSIVRVRDVRLILLPLSLPVLMLSSTLVLGQTAYENPSVNRGGPVIPVVFLLCALPAGVLLPALARKLRPDRLWAGLGVATVIAILLSIGGLNYRSYFDEFQAQQDITLAPTTRIAQTIKAYEDIGVHIDNVWLADHPFWLDIRNIGFTAGYPEWAATHNLLADDELPAIPPWESALFILNRSDTERLSDLRQHFPDGIVTEIAVPDPNRNFIAFWVPPSAPSEPGQTIPVGFMSGA
jgi:4-amino-4-deoxy-L-arabinose transferase-like glycosyltransferase